MLQGRTSPTWSPSGHLVYARKNRLLAVPFDLRRLEVSGEATTVLDGVSAEVGRGRTSFAISRAGSLAYLPGPFQDYARELAWVTREGQQTLASNERRAFGDLALAPDGDRVLVQVMGSDDDLWLVDLTRDTATRVTFGHENESVAWAADGKRFAWSSDRDGTFNLYRSSLDTGSRIERLTTSDNRQFVGSWSPDGRDLLFAEEDPTTLGDIWALQLEGGGQLRAIVRTPFDERTPVLSPDGRWLAYASNETGRTGIFVQAFPGPGRKRQVSDRRGADTSTPYRSVGRSPRWSRDGRELLYFNGNHLMAVPIQAGPSLEAGTPSVVFDLAGVVDFDVAPDGRRFLVSKWIPPTPLTHVVLALGGAMEIGGKAR